MSEFLPFIVIGLTTGAVYGLAGTGLVLTYKTSGIFNFAYGAIAALGVFVFYYLHSEHGMPWPWAALLVLFVLSPIEGLGLELFARILEPATATLKVVATIGLLLVVVGVGTLWYGNANVNFPPFLDTNTIRFLGVNVGWDQITVVIVSLVSTAVLYYFFRSMRLGVAMRGVVDNPDLVSMTGTNPVSVRRWAWIIGTIFASMAGLLLAPSLSLNAEIIVLLVVQAFGAAAIGYFSNLPLTFVGGLFIGVAGALATKYAASVSWLTGLSAGLPFVILFIVLYRHPEGPPGRAPGGGRPGAAPQLVRPDQGALRGGGARPDLLLLRALLRGREPVHLVERTGLCDVVLVPRPVGQDLGADLVVPPGLRRRRGGGVRALHHQLPPALGAGTALGRPRRHPRRGHRRHPGHPAVGRLFGPRHLWLRHLARADVL